MQAAVHAHIELTAATSHNKLPVPRIAHLTLKTAVFNLSELPATLMLTLVCIAKLFLHLDDTASSLRGKYVRRRSSVHNLLSASDQVSFNPERAPALTSFPFCPTEIAKLSTTCATSSCQFGFKNFLGRLTSYGCSPSQSRQESGTRNIAATCSQFRDLT